MLLSPTAVERIATQFNRIALIPSIPRIVYSSEIAVRYLLLFKKALCVLTAPEVSLSYDALKLSLIYSLFCFVNQRQPASDVKPQNVILICLRVPLLTGGTCEKLSKLKWKLMYV